MLAKELLERRQQLVRLQAAAAIDVPRRVGGQRRLGGVGELARDHLPVQRIGDRDGPVDPDEPQVADVFQVVARQVRGGLAAAEEQLYDAADARFGQLVGELVQMRVAAQDDPFARLIDRGDRHRPPAAAFGQALDRVLRERVDQPGLPVGERPDAALRFRRPSLPGRRGMLREQPPDLVVREVAQP